MKFRVAFLASFAVSLFASAVFAQAPSTPPPAAAAHEDTTELGEKMSAIGKAFKKLRGQISDPAKNQDSLALVATMRENAIAASKLPPAKKADLPAAEQEKFQADYVSGMKSFVTEITKLEALLQAGNNEEAKKQVDALNNLQKDSHKEFRKKKTEKK